MPTPRLRPLTQRLIGAALAIVLSGGVFLLQPAQAAAPTLPATPSFLSLPADQRPVLKPGDSSEAVRWMQLHIGGNLTGTGYFGSKTEAQVRAYQVAHGLPNTGLVAAQTWQSLAAGPAAAGAAADPRPEACRYIGKVICVSKAGRNVTMYDGRTVVVSMDARFGDADTPATTTHNGVFKVERKYEMWHSTIYNNAPMPYSLFFTNDGEAIHYSSTFARQGYSGYSKGCVNVRDMAKAKQLYDAAPVGTRVVVY